MELRPEFLVPAIAKTLKDVVLPALDDEHQVAQEQIKLAIGFLEITATTNNLRSTISAMIDAGHGQNDPLLSKDLSAKMRVFAKVQLCRERAWVEPMGFETGAEDLPSIEGQLKAH